MNLGRVRTLGLQAVPCVSATLPWKRKQNHIIRITLGDEWKKFHMPISQGEAFAAILSAISASRSSQPHRASIHEHLWNKWGNLEAGLGWAHDGLCNLLRKHTWSPDLVFMATHGHYRIFEVQSSVNIILVASRPWVTFRSCHHSHLGLARLLELYLTAFQMTLPGL